MKKKEFKKLLKEKKHPIIKEDIYGNIYNVIIIIEMITLTLLQMKNIIPAYIALIIIIVFLVPAIMNWILEIIRDKKLKEMLKYYNEKREIKEVKTNINVIKILLVIALFSIIFSGSFIITKYGFNDDNIIKEEILSKKTNDGETIEMQWYSFDNDNFSLKVPKNFYVLDSEEIKLKYPNGNPPSYVLSNENASINIALNITSNLMKNSQIRSYIKQMEEQLSSMYNIIDTRFFERDGREIGEIKFVSSAKDTDIYNHMIAFSDNGYLRIVSFNCTKQLQDNWQDVGEFIINSIKFN